MPRLPRQTSPPQIDITMSNIVIRLHDSLTPYIDQEIKNDLDNLKLGIALTKLITKLPKDVAEQAIERWIRTNYYPKWIRSVVEQGRPELLDVFDKLLLLV